MFASRFMGLNLPYWEIWVPLLVGMFAGGLCIVTFRIFTRRPGLVGAPDPSLKRSQNFDPFVHGSPTEQRKAHRRGGNPVEVLIAADQETNPSWRGWVLDRSIGGMCLAVNENFEEGTLVRVLPVNAPSMTPWTELEIRSCRPAQEGYEAGCQFVRQPPWSVLLMFG